MPFGSVLFSACSFLLFPTTEISLGNVQRAKQKQAHAAQYDNARVHFQIVDSKPRIHDEIPHAVLRAESLGEEQHGNRRRQRHANRRHEFRKRRGQKHLPKHHAKRRAEGRQRVKDLLRHGAYAIPYRDNDLENKNQKQQLIMLFLVIIFTLECGNL